MLASNRLRLDPGDGSPVVDYRLENGRVESRLVSTSKEQEGTEKKWHQLTPEELMFHVMAGTVVARWLRRRMGVFPLIRACTLTSPPASGEGESTQAFPTQLSA